MQRESDIYRCLIHEVVHHSRWKYVCEQTKAPANDCAAARTIRREGEANTRIGRYRLEPRECLMLSGSQQSCIRGYRAGAQGSKWAIRICEAVRTADRV